MPGTMDGKNLQTHSTPVKPWEDSKLATDIATQAEVDLLRGMLTPVITSSTDVTTNIGSSFSYTITATNSPTSFTATNLPTSLTLSGATITGHPTILENRNVAISATNTAGTGNATLNLHIKRLPVITTTTFAFVVGTPVSYQVIATNLPATFVFTAGTPPGLVISSSGLITGTPTTVNAGDIFRITATNTSGAGTGDFGFATSAAVLPTLAVTVSGHDHTDNDDVVAIDHFLDLSVSPSRALIAGESMSVFMDEDDSVPKCVFNGPTLHTPYFADGLDANGHRVETVTTTITPKVTWVSSTAPLSGSDTGTAITLDGWTIDPGGVAPSIIYPTNSLAVSGRVGETALTGMGGLDVVIAAGATPTVTYSMDPIPAGMSFNTSTGVISGAATAVMPETTVTFTASNTKGTSSVDVLMTIAERRIPLITSATTVDTDLGGNFTYQITADGAATITYTNSIPAWAPNGAGEFTGSLASQTGEAYDFPITITATNSYGSDTKVLTISYIGLSDFAAPIGLHVGAEDANTTFFHFSKDAVLDPLCTFEVWWGLWAPGTIGDLTVTSSGDEWSYPIGRSAHYGTYTKVRRKLIANTSVVSEFSESATGTPT